MKILTYSFPGAKITTRPVRFEISSSRNTAEGPRNRADIRHQCSQPVPNPCWCHHQRGVTIASPSLLPRDGTSRLSNSDRSKGDGTDWTEREKKRERERVAVSGGAIRIYIRVKLNHIGGLRGWARPTNQAGRCNSYA